MSPQPMIAVPKAAWSDVQELLKTPLTELTALERSLDKASPTPDVEDLAEACASETGLTPKQAESILTIAISLSALRRELQTGPTDALEAFAAALDRQGFPEWKNKFADAWTERFEFLAKLIRPDSVLDLMGKVRDLLYEFQSVLQSSTVLTDVRHVYDDAGAIIRGGMVLHTLSLRFREDTDTKQLHITLSPKDITQLIGQLHRAQKKALAATELLEKSGLPELTPKRNVQS